MMRSLALAAVFVVAAFGSVQAADPAPVSITIKDRQFVPAEVTVPAGAKVELQIRNEQTTAAEFESKSMRREKVIPPGVPPAVVSNCTTNRAALTTVLVFVLAIDVLVRPGIVVS